MNEKKWQIVFLDHNEINSCKQYDARSSVAPNLDFYWWCTQHFFENKHFLLDYWRCKISSYFINSWIIGGAVAPDALQVWRHWRSFNFEF